MNTFTKEELLYLLEEINYRLEDYQQPEIEYTIRDKLQSMIDNYCEHKSHQWHSGNPGAVRQCLKCGLVEYP